MSAARFAYTIITVPDVKSTIAFFEEAFGFERGFVSDDGDYGELQTGEVTLSFVSESLSASNLPAGFQPHRPDQLPFAYEIALVTDDVQQTMDNAISAGATLVSAAKQKPWGQTVGYVRDRNGILIEVCTPVSS
ncbi:MAG: VOC family protein [Thermomicrobiales bacterium]